MTLYDTTMFYINQMAKTLQAGHDPRTIDVLVQAPMLPSPMIENYLEVAAILPAREVPGGFISIIPGKPV